MCVAREGWDRWLTQQLREAERRFGPIGVAGVYGVGEVIAPAQSGRAVRGRAGGLGGRSRAECCGTGPELPAAVATLDELLLVVPARCAGCGLTRQLGFQLYGADLCLQARAGLAVVALAVRLCQHNSRTIGLPERLFPERGSFAHKWATACRWPRHAWLSTKEGLFMFWATPGRGSRSVAFAVGGRQ